MTDPYSAPVPNPALGWLHSLLTYVHAAQAAIPLLDGPTSSIGPGPAWTGSKALDVHDHDLAPHVRPFREALQHLDDLVRAEIKVTDASVPAGEAKMMRIERQR